MKKLYIFLFLLSGCATQQQCVETDKVVQLGQCAALGYKQINSLCVAITQNGTVVKRWDQPYYVGEIACTKWVDVK